MSYIYSEVRNAVLRFSNCEINSEREQHFIAENCSNRPTAQNCCSKPRNASATAQHSAGTVSICVEAVFSVCQVRSSDCNFGRTRVSVVASCVGGTWFNSRPRHTQLWQAFALCRGLGKLFCKGWGLRASQLDPGVQLTLPGVDCS